MRRTLACALLAVAVAAPTVHGQAFSNRDALLGPPTLSDTKGRLQSLVFTSAVPRLLVRQTFQMTVGVLNSRRIIVPASGARWDSSEPAVVSVSSTGVVTGLREGRSVISATLAGQSVRVRISVVASQSASVVSSVEVTPLVDTIETKSTLQFVGTARSTEGVVMTGAPISWSSRDTSVASITTDGLLTGRRAGTAQIAATSGSVTTIATVTMRTPRVVSIAIQPTAISVTAGDSTPVTVSGKRSDGSTVEASELIVSALRGRVSGTQYLAPSTAGTDSIIVRSPDGITTSAPVAVTAAVVPTNRIALQLHRFDGGRGMVLVSSGVPLAPGQLKPSEVAKTRLVIGSREVAANIRALKGLHRDGSLRSVLVQASVDIGATPVAAELQLGVVPSLAPPAAVTPQAKPAAMALPTTAQLIASLLVGPTRSIDSTTLSGYDGNFRSFAESQWTENGADWATMNYYDRVLSHVTFWVRGGGSVYLRRAMDLAVDYREKYIVTSGYLPSPHWLQVEGLAVHYWLTGDESSRYAVAQSTRRITVAFSPAQLADTNFAWRDGRIAARMLMATSLSSLLDDDPMFKSLSTGYVNTIVSTMRPDGSYFWKGWNGQGNFMVALQNDALIKYTQWIANDARIAPVVKQSLDYLWSTQWISSAGAFRYASGPTTEDASPSADLNMLFASSYAWYWKFSGNSSYRTRADEIAVASLANAWLSGTKQFNQFYYNSPAYLAYRR